MKTNIYFPRYIYGVMLVKISAVPCVESHFSSSLDTIFHNKVEEPLKQL